MRAPSLPEKIYRSLDATSSDAPGITNFGNIHDGLASVDSLITSTVSQLKKKAPLWLLSNEATSKGIIIAFSVAVIAAVALRTRGVKSTGGFALVGVASFSGLAYMATKDPRSFELTAAKRMVEVSLVDLNSPVVWLLLAGSATLVSHSLVMLLLGFATAQSIMDYRIEHTLLKLPTTLDEVSDQINGVPLTDIRLSATFQRKLLDMLEKEPNHNLSKLFANYYAYSSNSIPMSVEGVLSTVLYAHTQAEVTTAEGNWDKIKQSIDRDSLIMTKSPEYPGVCRVKPLHTSLALPKRPSLASTYLQINSVTRGDINWVALSVTITSIFATVVLTGTSFVAIAGSAIAFAYTFYAPLNVGGSAQNPLLNGDDTSVAAAALVVLVSVVVAPYFGSTRTLPVLGSFALGVLGGNYGFHAAAAHLDNPKDFKPQFDTYPIADLVTAASSHLSTNDLMLYEILEPLRDKLEGVKNTQAVYVITHCLCEYQDRGFLIPEFTFLLAQTLAALQTPLASSWYGSQNNVDRILSCKKSMSYWDVSDFKKILESIRVSLFSQFNEAKSKATKEDSLFDYIIPFPGAYDVVDTPLGPVIQVDNSGNDPLQFIFDKTLLLNQAIQDIESFLHNRDTNESAPRDLILVAGTPITEAQQWLGELNTCLNIQSLQSRKGDLKDQRNTQALHILQLLEVDPGDSVAAARHSKVQSYLRKAIDYETDHLRWGSNTSFYPDYHDDQKLVVMSFFSQSLNKRGLGHGNFYKRAFSFPPIVTVEKNGDDKLVARDCNIDIDILYRLICVFETSQIEAEFNYPYSGKYKVKKDSKELLKAMATAAGNGTVFDLRYELGAYVQDPEVRQYYQNEGITF